MSYVRGWAKRDIRGSGYMSILSDACIKSPNNATWKSYGLGLFLLYSQKTNLLL